ncbi:MAG TPA: endonuclease/exonuclease/phosphatase family protein [Rugosimonospora sp.]|nr:endonuclease/exonuclease/phosphatase family protein [Rugosimonospora sp.]
MTGRGERALRQSVTVAALAACAAVILVGFPSGGTAARPALRVLQLNLCDSGIAGCYTGRSVPAAAALVRADVPDVVTLNEVCEPDVAALAQALTGARPGATVASAFQPALDRRTGAPFRCRNGAAYGIGVLVRRSGADGGYPAYHGIYPVQDTADPEERAWLCLRATGFYACTTHLASTLPAVALSQCGYLLGTAIPAVLARAGNGPVVVGGDFNLSEAGTPALAACVPARYLRADDGGVQHVLATGFAPVSTRELDMAGTTDHPGLLVALTPGG